MRFPDLICLGAQKSATTWLYDVFKSNKDLFLPPIKELHYFSQIYNKDASEYGPRHRDVQCEKVQEWVKNKQQDAGVSFEFLELLNHIKKAEVSDSWYARIFSAARPEQVCVEICPSYMNMPQAGVQHLLRLNPSVRLLVLIRDPVDRCWSQIRMHVARGIQDENFEALLAGSASLWPYLFYTDYASSLRRWERYAAPGQLKLMLHDDILKRPSAAVEEIFDFIGLKPSEISEPLAGKIFEGVQIEFPTELRRRLMDALSGQYDFLKAYFPNAVSRWIDVHEGAINAALLGRRV